MKPGADLDECEQRAEWRGRLIASVIGRNFDDETLTAMLSAGLDQAHEEGIADAADICGKVAVMVPAASRVARILEKSLRALVILNKRTTTQ